MELFNADGGSPEWWVEVWSDHDPWPYEPRSVLHIAIWKFRGETGLRVVLSHFKFPNLDRLVVNV